MTTLLDRPKLPLATMLIIQINTTGPREMGGEFNCQLGLVRLPRLCSPLPLPILDPITVFSENSGFLFRQYDSVMAAGGPTGRQLTERHRLLERGVIQCRFNQKPSQPPRCLPKTDGVHTGANLPALGEI